MTKPTKKEIDRVAIVQIVISGILIMLLTAASSIAGEILDAPERIDKLEDSVKSMKKDISELSEGQKVILEFITEKKAEAKAEEKYNKKKEVKK